MKKIAPARSDVGTPDEAMTVLYVEDEDDNWEVARLQLGRRFNLVRASGDREAIEKIQALGSRLEAILMDIQLKGSRLDGVELTRLLRGKLGRRRVPDFATDVGTIETPIVFVTACGARFPDADLLAAGGDAVVSKPVDFVRLNLVLANLHLTRVLATTTS